MTERSEAEKKAAAILPSVLVYLGNRDGTYRLLRDEFMEVLVRAYTVSDDGYEVARFLERAGVIPDGNLVGILQQFKVHMKAWTARQPYQPGDRVKIRVSDSYAHEGVVWDVDSVSRVLSIMETTSNPVSFWMHPEDVEPC